MYIPEFKYYYILNFFFSISEYEPAIDLYSQGIDKCPKSFSKTLSILYSNRAACYMKLVRLLFSCI